MAVIGLSSQLTDAKGQIVNGKFRFQVAMTQSPEDIARGAPYAQTAYFLLSRKQAPAGLKTYSLYVATDPEKAGTVYPSGGNYQAGSAVTVTATPTLGFVFDHWSGDASGTSPSALVIMTSDKGVVAHFRTR